MKNLSKRWIEDYRSVQNHIGAKLFLSPKLIFIIGLFLLIGIFCSCSKKEKIPIRIGYSSLTPIHCHIGEVFSHTGILEKYQLDATLTSFRRGYEQGRAIKKGEIDVAFGCEVPAIFLVVLNRNMKIVASPGVLGKIAVVVPEDSDIYKMADMRGKKIAVCKGSTAHKDLICWIQQADLNPDRDIQIVDIPLEKMEKALLDRLVDAIVTWDPWVEMMVRRSNLRIIRNRPFRSVVVMSQEYIDKYPEGAIRYLQALKEALFWAATNKDKTNLWVAEKSGWDLDVVKEVSKLNKNFYDAVKIDDIDIPLRKENIQILEDCVAFLKRLRAIPRNFNLNKFINSDLIKKVDEIQ